ncbi:4363_t:CDS:2, partial [Cetraspora pellucida]
TDWVAIASSGIASLIMPGGRTTHSRFKIPIPVDANSSFGEDIIRIPDQMTISWQDNYEKSLEKLTQCIYLELSKNTCNTSYIVDCAILMTKNEYVDY